MRCPPVSLRHHHHLNYTLNCNRLIAGKQLQPFSCTSKPFDVKTSSARKLDSGKSSHIGWRRTENHGMVLLRPISCSIPPLTPPSSLEHKLDQAQSEKDVIRILEIAHELKRCKPISPDHLRLMYGHLVTVLGHYGLWTQLYATVNELFDAIPIQSIDDALWSTILDGFIQCGKSTDVILSLLLSSRDENHRLGTGAISSLFRAAIIESNLGQSIYLLQTSVKFGLIQMLDKTLLIQLACLFLEHNQTLLAIDLVHNLVLPITPTDHPDCRLLLIQFLRKSLDQSDPQSTLYCYSYLANHHSERIQELIQQDSGLMVQLLNLASRHIKPELTLNVLSQLVMVNKNSTPSSDKNKLKVQHLIPSVVSLCRAGGHTEQAIKILIGIEQDYSLLPQEIELLVFNLYLSHLGGQEQSRKLHVSNNQGHPTASIDEKDVQISIDSLNESEKICEKVITIEHENLVKGNKSNHDQPNQKQANSIILTSLINSLIQANLEMNRVDRSIEIFKSYFQNLAMNPSSPPSSLLSLNRNGTNGHSFNYLKPDQFTLSLLKNASDRISDHQIQSQISSLIDHHLQQSHSP